MQPTHGFYDVKSEEIAEIGSESAFRAIMESMTDGVSKNDYFTLSGGYLLQIIFMSLMAVVLAGCSSGETYSLAQAPPNFDPYAPREAITELSIEPAAGAGQGPGTQVALAELIPEYAALKQEARPAGCRPQDRFDRKALLAYEWGGRSRVGLDVDGIGFDSFDVEQVKVQYRLRFDAYKTKRERCRYNSQWQGMIGTGYNELFMREKDTLWQELNVLSNNVEDRWGTLLH